MGPKNKSGTQKQKLDPGPKNKRGTQNKYGIKI